MSGVSSYSTGFQWGRPSFPLTCRGVLQLPPGALRLTTMRTSLWLSREPQNAAQTRVPSSRAARVEAWTWLLPRGRSSAKIHSRAGTSCSGRAPYFCREGRRLILWWESWKASLIRALAACTSGSDGGAAGADVADTVAAGMGACTSPWLASAAQQGRGNRQSPKLKVSSFLFSFADLVSPGKKFR